MGEHKIHKLEPNKNTGHLVSVGFNGFLIGLIPEGFYGNPLTRFSVQ
jgi:hypothetical protein